jgi:hypothetical protein
MRLLIALMLLLAAPAASSAQVADPAPPGATTDPASAVARTTATLAGTVDPNGSATTYRFEYGTTTAYGLQTPEQDAGEDDGEIAAEAPVARLSPDTTYHFRIVATNDEGTTEGADRTFRTAPNPRPPGVTRTGAGQIGPGGAVLHSRIDPNDGATTYRFEFGRTRAYGWRTPDRDAGAGDRAVAVGEPIGGLEPFQRYHFRLVATNEAGQTFSRNRSFVTSRVPTAITLELEDVRSPWGEGTEVFGQVSGTGVRGTPVALERQDFPFTGPFSSIGTPLPVRADRRGRFRMFVPALFSTTRLRAVTRTAISVASPAVSAHVSLRVGAAARRISRKRMRLRGAVHPAVPNGRAVLQRRTSRGGWTFVRSSAPRPLRGDRSRYTFEVTRKRATRRYRVRVIARDGGAHVPGNSRTLKVKALKRR